MRRVYTTASEGETIEVARNFALSLSRGDVLALYGDLGSGKTQFVKGICKAFDVRTHVSSPSFVILNRHEGRDTRGEEILIYHFDLYRVESEVEIYDLGYEEFFANEGICLVEWADHLGALLPQRRHDIRLGFGDAENIRTIVIESIEVGDHPSIQKQTKVVRESSGN